MPPAVPREICTVKWFADSKGFGFLTRDNGGGDAFVHYSEICDVVNDKLVKAKGFKTLAEGDKVECEIVQGVKGLAASKVTKVS